MKRKLIFAVSILLFSVGTYFIGKASLPYIFDSIGGYDRNYIEKMKSIEIGMTDQEVINLLGSPDGIIKRAEVIQTHGKYGHGKEYGKIIKNENKVLYYHHGVDYIGHYFINKENKVYFINVGGT
jgi:hypothetical protein